MTDQLPPPVLPVKRWPLVLGAAAVAILLFVQLKAILMPFAVGGLIAYLGDPLVDRLEERGHSRTTGVIAVFAFFTLLLLIVLSILMPMVLQQLDALIKQIPDAYRWLSQTLLPWIQSRLNLGEFRLPAIDWEAELAAHWQSLGRFTTETLRNLTASGANLLLGLVNLALVPVVAFYLMRDWDRMVEKVLDLMPKPWQQNLSLMAAEADDVLGAFLRGQFVVMMAQAVMYSIGLWISGIPYAFLLGTLAGLASIIPYAGATIGVGSSLLVAWFSSGGEVQPLFLVALVFAVGQTIESMILTPVLIGDRIGLHPVAVIFALMAGGELAGFTGMLVALPVAAVLLVFFRHAIVYYRQSAAYQSE